MLKMANLILFLIMKIIKVLEQKLENKMWAIASLTKLMTAYVFLKKKTIYSLVLWQLQMMTMTL